MPKVTGPTVRCNGCGDLRTGDLRHGSRCPRCESGTFLNVALIAADETPEPWSERDDQGAA